MTHVQAAAGRPVPVTIETAAEFIARKAANWKREQARQIKTKDIGREGFCISRVN